MEAQMTQQFCVFKEKSSLGAFDSFPAAARDREDVRCPATLDVSCEGELEELMQQIDIMVTSKKVEWEKEVQVLEQRLEAQEQELNRSRGALHEKDCQIGILSKKLEQVERSREETVQSYEEQLEVLQSQLCKLKRKYDKLHFYHVKGPESEPMQEKHQSDLPCLSHKLEEFKLHARQWEKQRLLYQKNLKTLSEQRKSLAEKCDFFQKQSQSYREQLSSQTQLPNELLASSHSELQSLRSQMNTWQERVGSEGHAIGNLKSAIEEITLSRDSVKEENQQLLQELRHCQMRCQRLETELSEATIELQARDDLLRAVELDERQMHMDLVQYKKSQGIILSSKESDTHRSKRTMNKEQVQKRVKLSNFEQDEVEKYSPNKKSGDAGLESVRADIYDLTAKLKEQDVTSATLREKLSELERELHVRVMENANLQVQRCQGSQCEKQSRVLGTYCFPPPEEEEPVKCPTDARNMEEEPAERMEAALGQSRSCRTQSQTEGWCRSYNEESHCKLVKPLNNSTSGKLALLNVFDPCDSGWGTSSQSLLVDQSSLEAIFPSMNSDTCAPQHGHRLPEMDFSQIFVCEQQNEPIDGEKSFISAAEMFLQEESRRAEDFEKTLNSHIEELQKQSEHTVARYTSCD